jgi:prepilin-type processing-associated H-X9-DG protein
MNETEKLEQGRRPKGQRLANASLVLSILSFIYVFLLPFDVGFSEMSIGVVLSLAGVMLGIVALVKTKTVEGRLERWARPILGIVICVVLMLLFVYAFYASQSRHIRVYRLGCLMHLHTLGVTVLLYANDFDGKYPPVDKWCDLLVQYGGIDEKQFVCKSALRGGDKGRCHYAMNPNCEPNSPEDVVLLFETKGGWNRFGGPEILTFENHKEKGCNVLFNDGHVKFVKPGQVSKLKWKAE